MNFETRRMDKTCMCELIDWFDHKIGTDREVNEVDGKRYMVAIDLTWEELNRLANMVDHIIEKRWDHISGRDKK